MRAKRGLRATRKSGEEGWARWLRKWDGLPSASERWTVSAGLLRGCRSCSRGHSACGRLARRAIIIRVTTDVCGVSSWTLLQLTRLYLLNRMSQNIEEIYHAHFFSTN